MDENSPLAKLADESVDEVTNEAYGALKALCEQAAEKVMPGRVLVVRPGLIVGPDDPTDRFTYWPYRVSQGGEMLVPGRPDQQIQFIDVRDLAKWIVRMVEEGKTCAYNATGPDYTLTKGGSWSPLCCVFSIPIYLSRRDTSSTSSPITRSSSSSNRRPRRLCLIP